MDALSFFNEAKLACNVDLIYGWPEQTIDDMMDDLGELVQSGVRHITHYQLNIAGRSDFSKSQRDTLPSLDETIEMYRESVRFLTAHGFRQAIVYDWERVAVDESSGRFQFAGAEKCQYETHMRELLRADDDGRAVLQHMIGVGYAAIILPPSTWEPETNLNWMQINYRSLEGYYSSIRSGRFPVEKQFLYQLADMKLVWLFQAMQTLVIDLGAYQMVFGADVVQEFRPVWDELVTRDWIEITDDAIRFVDIGAFHIPMLQALLSHTRLGELRSDNYGMSGTRRIVPIQAVS
jgi:oxygen-independent coproporphyrinogen-3 oxidase